MEAPTSGATALPCSAWDWPVPKCSTRTSSGVGWRGAVPVPEHGAGELSLTRYVGETVCSSTDRPQTAPSRVARGHCRTPGTPPWADRGPVAPCPACAAVKHQRDGEPTAQGRPPRTAGHLLLTRGQCGGLFLGVKICHHSLPKSHQDSFPSENQRPPLHSQRASAPGQGRSAPSPSGWVSTAGRVSTVIPSLKDRPCPAKALSHLSARIKGSGDSSGDTVQCPPYHRAVPGCNSSERR